MKKLIPIKPHFAESAHVDLKKYQAMYKESIENPESFWAQQAERLTWFKKWDKVKSVSYQKPVSIKWFEGGELNISYNCIDRHLARHANKTAILWESDDVNVPSQKISYQKLHDEVCRYANVLKKNGVCKGDIVTIYMPMIPEAAYGIIGVS